MPQLKVVLACEKVIYDQEGPASVISIFESMRIRLQDVPMPERAIAPNQWAIFTLWEPTPSDTGAPFTQVLRVFAPDGSLFLENEHTIVSMDPARAQLRVRINVHSLPIWQPGKVEIKVFMKGNEAELGSTCFNIVYVPKEDETQPIQDEEDGAS